MASELSVAERAANSISAIVARFQNGSFDLDVSVEGHDGLTRTDR